MKFCALQLFSVQALNVKHPLGYYILPMCHLIDILADYYRITVPTFHWLLFYLNNTPKCKSSDAENLDILLLCLIYELNLAIGNVCIGKI